MARDWPIKLHLLTPLLDVVGNTNKYIRKVGRFFEKYGQMDLFPVKMQVRLMHHCSHALNTQCITKR